MDLGADQCYGGVGASGSVMVADTRVALDVTSLVSVACCPPDNC